MVQASCRSLSISLYPAFLLYPLSFLAFRSNASTGNLTFTTISLATVKSYKSAEKNYDQSPCLMIIAVSQRSHDCDSDAWQFSCICSSCSILGSLDCHLQRLLTSKVNGEVSREDHKWQ